VIRDIVSAILKKLSRQMNHYKKYEKAVPVRGNGIEDKREIGEIFRGYRNSQKINKRND
jgi:hypothetical protein